MTAKDTNKHQRRAILIVGLHSSGKSTLSKAFSLTGPFEVFELGDGVRETASQLGKTNLVLVASEILSSGEPTKLVKIALEKSKNLKDTIPIFVGARTIAEKNHLLSFFPDLITLGLKSSEKTRKERWNSRQLQNSDKWIEREKWEANWQTSTLVNESHAILNSTDSIPSLCLAISAEIEKLWS
ncbi:hypothetical protein [Pseudomonas rustica]|uniref:hypothetical protein n=1 Tax=Pseudomonas rustica TaxID=2827099 RepID=UPI001BB059CA|nr:hypothetical protein [Pseudomonas rustica]MBS4088538.1 hypothetical protein [Pseudomonas rustica]